MNVDVFEFPDGSDIVTRQSDAARAGNVLAVQLGNLEYAKNFGVDLKYFFQSDFQFQNESFKAYLVQRLIEHQINVSSVTDVLESLYNEYTFNVGSNNDTSTTGLL